MAYYQAEATWRPDESGERLEVALEFFRLALSADGAPVGLGDLLGEDAPRERRSLGRMLVAEPALITPLRVRRAALEWLRDVAGMTGADSLEYRIATQADVEFLDRLTAPAAA